jgi:2-alkenal reductase
VNDKRVRRLSDLTGVLDEVGIGHDVKIDIMRDNRSETVNVAVADVGQSQLNTTASP